MKSITPVQHTGKSIDASSERVMHAEEAAVDLFVKARERLVRVAQWHSLVGQLSAKFEYFDANLKQSDKPPGKGGFLRIDIPGPGSKSGDGYDWVQVEEIENTTSTGKEVYGFRVRPVSNPLSSNEETSHFYSSEATSTFEVIRQGSKVTANIKDRNIKPNMKSNNVVDKVRDAVIGAAGSLSFSKIQWQALTDAFIED